MKVNPTAALDNGSVQVISGQERAASFLARLEGTPIFACVVATTATAEIEGISAAGETPEKRRYTAALDAEFLIHGEPLSLPDIPRNPLGPPSPVVITKAALEALEVTPVIVDAGCVVEPQTPRIEIGGVPGKSIITGKALTLSEDFAQTCRFVGRTLVEGAPWAVLAESAPGGTTTALSVMKGLGVDASGKVSSSMPGGNHNLKDDVVNQALAAAGLTENSTALEVACAVGDPMQPALALMALEASLHCPVVLGGGTQMAAVYALLKRMYEEGESGDLSNIGIATTRWVGIDESADLGGLMTSIDPTVPVYAAWLNFSDTTAPGLAHYEQGLVKEGVGAGAAAFAALVTGSSDLPDLINRIEEITENL